MAMWKITPDWKKSCVERQYYVKDGMTVVEETGWRWGEFFVSTEGDDPPDFEEGDDIFCLSDGELVDWSTDDGCWQEIEYINVPEDIQEELETFFEENSIYDLEEQGWIQSDGEMYITCTVTIEKVED